MNAQEFSQRMRECAVNTDQEEAHHAADRLLLEMLESLAPLIAHLPDDARALADGIDAYDEVGKWYA